jgi:hypothetical protein
MKPESRRSVKIKVGEATEALLLKDIDLLLWNLFCYLPISFSFHQFPIIISVNKVKRDVDQETCVYHAHWSRHHWAVICSPAPYSAREFRGHHLRCETRYREICYVYASGLVINRGRLTLIASLTDRSVIQVIWATPLGKKPSLLLSRRAGCRLQAIYMMQSRTATLSKSKDPRTPLSSRRYGLR